MGELLVEMTEITKDFPGVHALSDARFELRPGEVHALVGENGAGKSTLMKILAGIYDPDAGLIRYKGAEVQIPNPRTARDLGISMIHQELNLMPHLTVAQNIFLGREPRGRPRFLVDDRRLNRQTAELIGHLHLKLDPRARVGDLKIAQQQMVEIAKALSLNAEVLVMDEPTAALTETEIEELFRIIRELRASGVGIVHISHRLEELKQISDRVTVMRDGHYIATLETAEASIPAIINMMVGRTIYEEAPEIPQRSGDVVLEVRGLTRGRMVRNVSFALHRGEILGVAGLVGAGRTEVVRAIFGADRLETGEIYVHGRRVEIRSPADAVKLGIGYLSEDRKRFGLALGMDVETNIVLAALRKFLSSFGRINTRLTRAAAAKRVTDLGIKTPSIRQRVRNLSGGTQQKVVVGKWLTADTEILIFDEPTRGIDVGAKNEIYHLLNQLVREGKSIIMISSELPEIIRMSHRIIVMCEGRLTGELSGAGATQEAIMTFATQRASVAEATPA
ncbi:MAG TPA: sugar ABC transporter ATP-binding protein [Candidatus Limnocylindrales bacterium]|nr:sugar ABC transporter ATP-binding protein [Candidatus Limnocylindrales bacterium]